MNPIILTPADVAAIVLRADLLAWRDSEALAVLAARRRKRYDEGERGNYPRPIRRFLLVAMLAAEMARARVLARETAVV